MTNFRYIDFVDRVWKVRIGIKELLAQLKFILKVQSIHFMAKVFSNRLKQQAG